MMRYLIIALSLFSMLLCSSCDLIRGKTYTVAIDPTFFPEDMGGDAEQAYGFSIDLLQAMTLSKLVRFNPITVGTQDLVSGLMQKQYEAILSSMSVVGKKRAVFLPSTPYLSTGPVLVVKKDSHLQVLKDMEFKLVGVLPNSEGTLQVQKYPLINMENFPVPKYAFEALLKGDVDGVVIDALIAYTYCHNLLSGQIKVVTAPMGKDGLKMIVLKNESAHIEKKFNKALKELKAKGIYQALRKKWGLDPCH